jgi:hypothetical protein
MTPDATLPGLSAPGQTPESDPHDRHGRPPPPVRVEIEPAAVTDGNTQMLPGGPGQLVSG